MFTKHLSDEAYLGFIALHGNVDFYLDRDSSMADYKKFAGYISVHKDSIFDEDLLFIYDPIHNLHFVPVRFSGFDFLYWIVVREQGASGKWYDNKKALNPIDFKDEVTSRRETISVRIGILEQNSMPKNIFTIRLEDDVRS